MGLLDTLAGEAMNALSSGANNQQGMMEVVTQVLGNSGTGGLPGLVSKFQSNGLGDIIGSWIGTGQNLPISAAQLQSVLSNEQLQTIAQKLGLSSGNAANTLATLLPQLIDKLTPNGQVPEGNLLEQGLSILKGFSTS